MQVFNPLQHVQLSDKYTADQGHICTRNQPVSQEHVVVHALRSYVGGFSNCTVDVDQDNSGSQQSRTHEPLPGLSAALTQPRLKHTSSLHTAKSRFVIMAFRL